MYVCRYMYPRTNSLLVMEVMEVGAILDVCVGMCMCVLRVCVVLRIWECDVVFGYVMCCMCMCTHTHA